MRDAILGWFDAHGRDLAFRRTRDPYAVLVSEAMAQQTQIGRATAAWSAWMTRFPTVRALADASPADVLRQWQGLGYNRRALNLHRAAKAIVADHGGRVPDTVEALRALPGIGPYTARASRRSRSGDARARSTRMSAASWTCRRRRPGGRPRPTCRRSPTTRSRPARPGAWTHALMDIGATFCRPARPRCDDCPARPWCRFAASPVRRPTEPDRDFDRAPLHHHHPLAPRPHRRPAARSGRLGELRGRDRRARQRRRHPRARRARPGRPRRAARRRRATRGKTAARLTRTVTAPTPKGVDKHPSTLRNSVDRPTSVGRPNGG